MNVFDEFCQTIKMLRDPIKGCPWDLKQTHLSLRKYMLEEAYEAVDAMSYQMAPKSPEASELAEELGDVLLQVVLNAQVAQDHNLFTIEDVIRSITLKMRRRHPHVFSSANNELQKITETEVRENWEKIKRDEGKAKGNLSKLEEQLVTVSKSFPSTIQAQKLGRIAEKVKFDWDTPRQVLDQLKDEIKELSEVMEPNDQVQNFPLIKDSLNPGTDLSEKLSDELGDVYFTLAQLCRHLGLDSEVVAMTGNKKFSRRFRNMDQLASMEGKTIEILSPLDKERLWNRVKLAEAEEKWSENS